MAPGPALGLVFKLSTPPFLALISKSLQDSPSEVPEPGCYQLAAGGECSSGESQVAKDLSIISLALLVVLGKAHLGSWGWCDSASRNRADIQKAYQLWKGARPGHVCCDSENHYLFWLAVNLFLWGHCSSFDFVAVCFSLCH